MASTWTPFSTRLPRPIESYTLYYAPGTASMSVHWLLIELGVPHELVKVDLDGGQQKTPSYLALNPGGVVPTLVIDGQPCFESSALLLLLAERHAMQGFSPPVGTAARAEYVMWIVHLANVLQPAFRAWFYPAEPAGPDHAEAAKQAARAKIEAAWERIDGHLASRAYIAGPAITAVDFFATMLMRWSRNMPRPATSWPSIEAYAARMKARPAFKTLYEREGLTDWA